MFELTRRSTAYLRAYLHRLEEDDFYYARKELQRSTTKEYATEAERIIGCIFACIVEIEEELTRRKQLGITDPPDWCDTINSELDDWNCDCKTCNSK
jgi:hypothetical protein